MRWYLRPALRQKLADCGPQAVTLPNKIWAARPASGAGAPAVGSPLARSPCPLSRCGRLRLPQR
eukprot:9304677-Pyramimonas_sp.AAC.1